MKKTSLSYLSNNLVQVYVACRSLYELVVRSWEVATRLYKLVIACNKVVGSATRLYELVLSCSKVVGGGYKVVPACMSL